MAFYLAGGKPGPVAKARPDGGADGLEDGILLRRCPAAAAKAR